MSEDRNGGRIETVCAAAKRACQCMRRTDENRTYLERLMVSLKKLLEAAGAPRTLVAVLVTS